MVLANEPRCSLYAIEAGALVYATSAADQVGLRRITGLESFLAWLGVGPVLSEPDGDAVDGQVASGSSWLT